MPAFSTIPLKILNSSGDLKQLTTVEEEIFANEGGLGLVGAYPTVSDRYGGAITLTNTADDSAIGVYKDTFYTSPIGTHPGTSISSGSTITTLRQMLDSVTEVPFTGAVPTLIVADSDGDLHDMDSASYNALALRVNELVQTQEGIGTFRLSATQPTAEYVKWIDTVFTDTLVNGSTNYHIWRKETVNVDPETYYPIKRTGANSYQEMTASEVGEVGNGMIQQGYFLNGVGEYELRSDSEGAPTAFGTWEARGTALDTKNTVQDVQYTTVQYTSPQFSRQYTGQYLGTYTNLRYSTLYQNFLGVRQIAYAGVRNYTNQYIGIRAFSANFVGVRPQSQTFIGARTFVGQRNYAGVRGYVGQFTGYFSGSRNYTSSPTQYLRSGIQFEGARNYTGQRNFTGQRTIAYAGNFSATVYQTFLGSRQVYFSGQRNYAGVRYFSGTRYFAGVRNFVGQRTFTGYFSGTRTGNETNFNGPMPGNFSVFGPFTQQAFLGIRYFPSNPSPPINPGFFGEFYTLILYFLEGGGISNSPGGGQTFSGWRQFAGVRTWQFAGTRASPGNFSDTFTGTRQFSGPDDIAVPGQFAIAPYDPAGYFTRPAQQFLGWAAYNFVGPRTAYYSGNRPQQVNFNFTSQYSIPFASPAINFVGSRKFAGSRNYAGNYSRLFSGTRNYGGQYLSTTPLSFVADRSFVGVRAFANTFLGVRSSPVTFVGTRPYAGDFTGATPQTFAGTRAVLYTGYYSGQYTGQYTSNYTSQYSAQYTGQTVLAIPGSIRTYTLYVRVSAT